MSIKYIELKLTEHDRKYLESVKLAIEKFHIENKKMMLSMSKNLIKYGIHN
jgi:hypothetical protein